ncbi:MAG: DUF998 domain-containing protein [Candidatus Kariarchaeaceae archaeon]|jgi:hypothetical protein
MTEEHVTSSELKNSYPVLNLVLGVLGLSLPTILYFGNWIIFEDDTLKGSISAYYHSEMRDVFVGYLFAMGLFLLTYQGYERIDFIAGFIAGVGALGVALFPTIEETVTERDRTGWIHVGATVVLYVTLAIMCMRLFTRSNQTKKDWKKKRWRNAVYYLGGIVVLLSVLAIGILSGIEWVDEKPSWVPDSMTFWLEYSANTAFGIAWLTKGEGIWFLNDDPIEDWSLQERIGVVGVILLVFLTTLMILFISS